MTLLVPDAGEVKMLGNILNKTTPENIVYRLYSNNITPAETDTAATYTEVSGSGYAAITLTGANWTITGGAPTTATYALQTWTFSGAAGNVYGYYTTEATSGVIKWAERATGAPINIATAGSKIEITPSISLD